MTTIWSEMQTSVFAFEASCRTNFVINAVAGSGKTTTVLEMIDRFVQRLRATGFSGPSYAKPVFFGAFSSKIKRELKAKVAERGLEDMVEVNSFHGLGFSVIKAHNGKANTTIVDDNKVKTILETKLIERPDLATYVAFALKAVNAAKCMGIGVPGIGLIDDKQAWFDMVEFHGLADESLSEAEAEYAEKNPHMDEDARMAAVLAKGVAFAIWALKQSNLNTIEVDYADMCYLPLVKIMRFPPWCRFDLIVIDECQDVNMTRLLLAQRAMNVRARIVAVGDPHQAIFGFTGALADAIRNIVSRFDCAELPLSVNYRCGRKIVDLAKTIVPHIEAHDGAEEGIIGTLDASAFDMADLTTSDAILCRNNAPLVQIAFKLIRRGIACRIEGKDIGKGLLAFTNRWKSVRTLTQLGDKMVEWEIRETKKAKEKNNPARVEYIADQAATMRALIEGAQKAGLDLTGLRVQIGEMFGDSFDAQGVPAKPMLVLSTYHKSKGLEWETVYLIDHHTLCPSKYAVKDWQRVQEQNLAYVAYTRAKKALYFVNTLAQAVRKAA